MTKDKDLEDYLDSIPGMPRQNIRNNTANTNPSNREINVDALLQQRIMQKVAGQGAFNLNANDAGIPLPPEMLKGNLGSAPGVSKSADLVYLKEGAVHYRMIPSNDVPMSLAIPNGPIIGVIGKEFINKGARKYYIIEGQKAIDLANPDYSKMQTLYAVEAPWVGTVLVPESALIKTNNNNKPQVLMG